MTHRDILIIGYGIVGKAVYEGLNKDEMNYIQVLDPPKDMNILDDGINDYADYGYYDGIIICLPTPQGPRGECDDMMVEQYHREIRAEAPGIPILIKSTISIELIKLLEDDLYLTFNPEFLTENDSIKEFCNQKFAIFGGENARYWYDIYINSGIKIDKVRFTSMINACYAKYAINCYLATKVIFFNELRDMYCDEGFDEVTELIALDERIGKSHMMVPGSDGKHGFGGMCLPKDTLAFATSASRKGSPLKLLEEAILINSKIREFYYSKIEDLPE
jgi:UDPglucose 6-dehydrogenase